MSRILTFKRSIFLTFLLTAVFSAWLSGIWWILVVAIVILAGFVANKYIIREIWKPVGRLRANRKVENIDTLVVGDVCSRNSLNVFCGLQHALCIMAPGRSLNSSALILKHLTSRLVSGGHVVIVDGGGNSDTTAFDCPYLSQIAKMRLNYVSKGRYIKYPIIFCLWQCIMFLIGRPVGRVLEKPCPNKEIVELCNRKGFRLTYLYLRKIL